MKENNIKILEAKNINGNTYCRFEDEPDMWYQVSCKPMDELFENNKAHFKVDSYKHIRQYIHNYLGLTKKEIRDMFWNMIEEIVEREVKACLNNKNKIQDLIEKSIVDEIRRQDNCERHSYTLSVMDDIYCKIDKVIHEEVRNKLIIGLKGDDEVEQDRRKND